MKVFLKGKLYFNDVQIELSNSEVEKFSGTSVDEKYKVVFVKDETKLANEIQGELKEPLADKGNASKNETMY